MDRRAGCLAKRAGPIAPRGGGGLWLGLAAAGLAGLLVGCGRPDPGAAAALFDRASAAYVEGRWRAAAELFREAARQSGDRGAEAQCWEGLSRLELGQAAKARALLERAHQEARADAVRARALEGLARLALRQHRYAEAETRYERLRRQYPQRMDEAQILAALIRCRTRQGKDASALVRTLRARHADSPYTTALETGTTTGARYVVQAGAFADRGKAVRLQERIERTGQDCFVHKRIRDGRTLHVVQVGAFSSHQAAEQQCRRLAAAGFAAVIVHAP